jgi:polysaccharide deacetylase
VSAPGVFILCVDFELAWGWSWSGSFRGREDRLLRGRESVPRLLDLLDESRIPATWATVGHLFLESCPGGDGPAHPEIVRPAFAGLEGDWYQHDPRTDVRSDPLWYASDLVTDIRSRGTAHEVGSHSFSHLPFGAPGCTAEAADSDLTAAVRVAAVAGVELRTFVYPQHLIGHTDLLAPHGFTAYRGEAREPLMGLPPVVRKPMRFLVRAGAIASRPQTPETANGRPAHLPASLFFALTDAGAGRTIGPRRLVARCIRGLRRAIAEGGMHQIYFHDHNMGVRTADFFGALGEVLAFAVSARDRGDLRILTMRDHAAAVRA